MKRFRLLFALSLAYLPVLSLAQLWRSGSTFVQPHSPDREYVVASSSAADGSTYAATTINGLQVTKYDSSGNLSWSNRYGVPVVEDPSAVVNIQACSDGVYVTGTVDRQYPFGEQSIIAKFSSAGALLWARAFNPKARESVNDIRIVVDPLDNVYMTVSFEKLTNHQHSFLGESYILKYQSNGTLVGTAPLLTTTYHGVDVLALKRSVDGSIFVTGLGTNPQKNLQNQAFLCKFGADLQPAWSHFEPNPVNLDWEVARDLGVGTDGSVYIPYLFSNEVATRFQRYAANGSLIFSTDLPNMNQGVVAVDGSGNAYLMWSGQAFQNIAPYTKFSPTGQSLWTKTTDGPAVSALGNPSGGFIAFRNGINTRVLNGFDASGNILWTANTDASTAKLESNGITALFNTDTQSTSMVAQRYSLNGTQLWQSNPISCDFTQIEGVTGTVDPNGNVFMRGLGESGVIAAKSITGISPTGQVLFLKSDAFNTTERDISHLLPYPGGGFVMSTGLDSHQGTSLVRRFDSVGNQVWQCTVPLDVANICLDADGNILGIEINSALVSSAFKISPAGIIDWQTALPASLVFAQSVGCDSGGSLYATFSDVNFGRVKVSAAGVVQWSFVTPQTSAADMQVDAGGNTYVIGPFGLAKYDSDGAIQWQTPIADSGTPVPWKLALDGDGNVYVAAENALVDAQGVPTSEYAVIAKFDAQTGNRAWSVAPTTYGFSAATDIRIESDGAPIISGWRYSPATSYDYLIAKFSPEGVLQRWEAFDSGFAQAEHPTGMGMDELDNAYVFGYSFGPTKMFTMHRAKFGSTDDSLYVTEVVPSTVNAGTSFTAKVTMQNIGSTTWTQADGYCLLSQDAQSATTWGTNRLLIPSSADVTPGANIICYNTLVAPSTPGTYPMQWRMCKNGVVFGGMSPGLTINVVANPDNAQFVSQKSVTNLAPGATFAATVTMKNTGSSSWTQANGYCLISLDPIGNNKWGSNRLLVPSSAEVGPGEQVVCSNSLTAPATPGTYSLHWQMYRNGVAFGSPTPPQVVIVAAPGDAQFVSQVVPASVAAGSTFTVKVTMQNTGATTWTQAGGFCLLSQSPTNNTTWGTNRLLIPSSVAVQPGQQVVCFNTLKAPTTPGTYSMVWRMSVNGSAFGASSQLVSITVSG